LKEEAAGVGSLALRLRPPFETRGAFLARHAALEARMAAEAPRP